MIIPKIETKTIDWSLNLFIGKEKISFNDLNEGSQTSLIRMINHNMSMGLLIEEGEIG